jgi:hypothetical protein
MAARVALGAPLLGEREREREREGEQKVKCALLKVVLWVSVECVVS